MINPKLVSDIENLQYQLESQAAILARTVSDAKQFTKEGRNAVSMNETDAELGLLRAYYDVTRNAPRPE